MLSFIDQNIVGNGIKSFLQTSKNATRRSFSSIFPCTFPTISNLTAVFSELELAGMDTILCLMIKSLNLLHTSFFLIMLMLERREIGL